MRTSKIVKRSGVTLDALLRAVSAYYKEKGDKISAGVSLAVLDNGTFYASVVRYPINPYGKTVVVATQKSTEHDTAKSAIAEVALKWYKVASQPSAKDAVRVLGDVGEAMNWEE